MSTGLQIQPSPIIDDRDAPVFGPEFVDTLEYLHVIARKILSGQLKAERRSKQKGVSVEFMDHRPYSPGDDFRFIDWSVFFRTDQLFLKLFEEQEDLQVYLLFDCSASMDFGMPYKWHYARRMAASIGYLGLAGMDHVHVYPFNDQVRRDPAETLRIRGKGKVFSLLQFLEGMKPNGVTNLDSALTGFARSRHKRGLALIISDLYDAQGVFAAANALRFQKFDPYIIHIVSPQEAAPDLLGDVRLIDGETGRVRDVTLTEKLLRKYRERFTEFCDSVDKFCRSKQIGYARCRTDVPFDDMVVHMLRRGKLLQ